MADPDGYVSGSSINFIKLASTLISSLILAWYAGATDFFYALISIPADLIEVGLGWVGETLGLGFQIPEETLEISWAYPDAFFPVAGPFDWILGILLVMVFFRATIWMIQRVQEGI